MAVRAPIRRSCCEYLHGAEATVHETRTACYARAVPIHYECVRCTECCRWPGQVKLSDEEITRMAAFLKLSEFDFIQQYTRIRPDRRGLALQDKATGECIFLEGRDCRVQAVKPQQCRDFPNGWNFPGFEKICRAIPREIEAGPTKAGL